ncbi:MAG: cytochrome C oxidase subunit IV family protein [Burkholderiales bacterium]
MKLKAAYKRSGVVWLALIALLLATLGSAYLPMGVWNGIANLVIATVKALLVAFVFMQLRADRPAFRIVVVAALFTLGLLFALSQADYATRVQYVAPWQVPQGAISRVR